jgi:hypothetical protein
MALKQVSNETSDTNAHGEVKKPSTKKTSTGRAPPHFWLVRMAPTTINDTMWPTAIRKKLIKLNTCSEPMLQYADHITPENYLKNAIFLHFGAVSVVSDGAYVYNGTLWSKAVRKCYYNPQLCPETYSGTSKHNNMLIT